MKQNSIWLGVILLGCGSNTPETPGNTCANCDGPAALGQSSAPLEVPDGQANCNLGQAQQFGDAVFGIEAESRPASAGNPTLVTVDAAYGRTAFKFNTTTDELSLPVTFREAGQYKLFIRARGFSTASDSVFVSDAYTSPPSAGRIVGFGRQDATFFWLDTGAQYDITAALLHLSRFINVRGREAGAEVDAIALVKVGSNASPDTPFIHTQTAGANVFAFAAEEVDSISDPDADTRKFVRTDGGVAQGWRELQAPPVSAGTDESRARYRVRFTDAGTYSLLLRGRGQDTAHDSAYGPSGFGILPQVAVNFPSGVFGWRTVPELASFVVAAADVGKVLEFEIGSREPSTELDSIAFARQGTSSTDATLDGALGHVEAESATLTGVSPLDHAAASGGKRVTGFGDVNDKLDFGTLAVKDRLYIRYSLERTLGKQASVYLDDVDVATVHFSSTGSWDSYATTFVYLPHAGRVRLQIDPDDYTMNLNDSSASIDRVSLSEGPNPCIMNVDQDISALLGSPGAAAGDTYVWPSGSFSNLSSPALSANGTPDRPVTVRAQNAGTVSLTGGQRFTLSGAYEVVDGLTFNGTLAVANIIKTASASSHNRVTNTTIEGGTDTAMGDWVTLGGKHNRLDHNHFVKKNSKGVVLVVDHGADGNGEYNKYGVIDANYFGSRRPGDPDAKMRVNGWETIRTGLSHDALEPANLIVKQNLFYHCDGEAEVVSNKGSDNYYFYNTFQESQGGLVMRQGDRIRIEGNVFLGTPGLLGQGFWGVRLHGTSHIVVNNHFQDMDTAVELGIGQAGLTKTGADYYCYWPVTDVLLAHNTTANILTPAIWVEDMFPCENKASTVAPARVFAINNYVKNAVFQSDQPGNVADIRYASNVTGSASPPSGWTTQSWTLTTDARGLLRPNVAHPGLAQASWPTGYPSYTLLSDLDGQPRATQPGIGADEFVSGNNSAYTRPPLKFADVGPSWGVRSTVQ